MTTQAKDKHDVKERLARITVPTLVVAGVQDACYTEALVRERAEGIPNARLILYEGMRHPASGERFGRDVLMFLTGLSVGARSALHEIQSSGSSLLTMISYT